MQNLKELASLSEVQPNEERRNKLAEFGADLAIDSRDTNWADQVLDATGGKGVDLIIDQLSGYVANDNLKATAIMGRIIAVGTG